jgi:hypothetical protein
VTSDRFKLLSKVIKPNKYYIHFWKDSDMAVIFRDKIFRYNIDDKSTQNKVVEYGLTLGIPIEQLDFPID